MDIQNLLHRFCARESTLLEGERALQIVSWDRRANTPAAAGADRGHTVGYLSDLQQQLLTSAELRRLLATLAQPEVLAESQRMCRAMSVACRVASTSMVGTSGTAAAIGTPAILIERGGQSGCSPEDQAAYREDLLSILAELGCLERPVTGNPRQMDITETAYYDAEANGCWHLLRQPGEEFQAGECLGRLTDFFGTVLQEITAPWDGFVLYGTVALGVRAGDSLLALARPPRG
mgnify:CR=1 FL=1